MGLMPLMISAYALKEDYDNSLEKFHAMDCIENAAAVHTADRVSSLWYSQSV